MTYEYECTKCSYKWEEEQSIKEQPKEICPKCSDKTAKRLISHNSFILKGKWAREGY